MMQTKHKYIRSNRFERGLHKMKFKKILLPFIAGALALSLAACGGGDKEEKDEASKEQQKAAEEMKEKLTKQQVDTKEIVAVVNGEELNGEQYNAALTSIQSQMMKVGQDPTTKEATETIKKQTLDSLVNQALLLQKANDAKIEVSPAEIDEEYEAFAKQFGDEEKLKEALKAQKMDVDTLKEQIAESIVFNKYTNQVAPAEEVTEKQIKEYYDQIVAEAKDSELKLPSLEEASEEIKGILEQDQQQKKLMAHVEELKESAEIELKI